ncbi:MAG: LutB/LldF family L-lactate oxidation iron-sulfur protein [Chloroflexota bacterium]|nr:LutB/LldF family L-lactate oxidation iron-sulfur protein [Chloroflexota bacterium]
MRRQFLKKALEALANPTLQKALDQNAERRESGRVRAFSTLPNPEHTRQEAAQIRRQTIDNLEEYLAQFIKRAQENSIQVHGPLSAHSAALIAAEIAKEHNARLIVKSKSMVSEEIELNQILEGAGMRVVETDLGEFIVQLRGEAPGHIITPAIHLLREDVAKTFTSELNVPHSTDVAEMTETARRVMRKDFLSADVGITGVNFGVAETGTLCIVTNEGNGRMVSTLPPVHIALMGVERLVPSLENLAVLLQVLARSATGQNLTSYVSLIQHPRTGDEADGAEERHLILVDNGRLAMHHSQFQDALLCLRCGACLNACPVFREIGGHTYGSAYPGPIGSLVSPGLFGIKQYGHLSKASTLCGACTEVCPAGIDFTKLLLRTRGEYIRSAPQPAWLRAGMPLFTWMMASPRRYRWVQSFAAIFLRILPNRGGWLYRLPPPFSGWTRSRDFPPLAAEPFHARLHQLKPTRNSPIKVDEKNQETQAQEDEPLQGDLTVRFQEELERVDGEFVRCSSEELRYKVADFLASIEADQILGWGEQSRELNAIANHLREAGIQILEAEIPRSEDGDTRYKKLAGLDQAPAGLTTCLAGLADTGTVILPSGVGQSNLTSLLPRTHLVILRAKDIYPTFDDWIRAGGREAIASSSQLTLITGPSRTADVEMILTLGVHGPERLVVFTLD